MREKINVDKSQQSTCSICKNPLHTYKVELLATSPKSMDSINSGSLLKEKWLYTRKAVKGLFGVSYVTLFNWDKANVIKSIKVGGRRYYTRTAIIEAINKNSLKSDNHEKL